jgi:hypothetical protein
MVTDLIKNLMERTSVAGGENYIVANLSNEVINGEMRGWICGHFYPKGTIFHRHDIEICFKMLTDMDSGEQLHFHLCSFEFLLVLSGKVAYEIDGDNHILTSGMFYMLFPGNTERLVDVFEPTTILVVRLPSIPRNRVNIDGEQNGR